MTSMAGRKVLLVGWDAADWKVIRPLIQAGTMSHVQRFVEGGASGQIATLDPPLSPMLWTSIATGKRPFKHGIHGFSEPTPDGRGVQPVTNLSRTSKALWNILTQSHLRSIVIGWWPSHPAEPINGVMVSDQFHRASRPLDEGWPLPANAVHPPELAETLAGLRMHPDLLTPRMVEPFIPRAREIDQESDKRLALFLRTLAESMSIQSAATWLMENEEWNFFAVYYDAIDHFCHGFMKFYPPQQSWISERDFELYHEVVSMAYHFHDQMLGSLIEKAGQDTTVMLISDHGFHPDHLRPRSIPDIPAGPAIEHRDFGILAISGPGIKKGELLHGASVLDVAPTILTLYGLPVGEDMDGKVLLQAFQETPKPAFVPSWEEVPGADGRHPPYTRLDPEAAHAALEQMIALGYLERPDENRQVAVERTIRELRYNLGAAYQDAARHSEAYQIFAELCAADPNEQRFAVRLFVSCQALGLPEEMRRIVEDLDGNRRALFEEAQAKIDPPRNPDPNGERPDLAYWRNLARYQPAVTDYLKAQVLTAERRYAEALAVLEQLAQAHLPRSDLFPETAGLYMRLGRWREAEQVFENVLANDPDNVQAHIGMSRMALRQRKFRVAVQSALNALERNHHHPLAHFLLGRALVGMKEYQRAAEAFRGAISLNPNFPEAHIRLAALLETKLGDTRSARAHRDLAGQMRRSTRLVQPAAERAGTAAALSTAGDQVPVPKIAEMPPLEESLIVVTGLPRSGTSMVMQMLAAGNMAIVSDGLRQPDEDNPRGYFEFEPVKQLLQDARWLLEARGKAIKIVAPLITALPPALPCRVVLCERDVDELLDSQERMRARRNQPGATTPERRRLLKDEYVRILGRLEAMFTRRPQTQLLVIHHRRAIADPLLAARRLNQFLGGSLDEAKMAASVDPALYRNRGVS